MNLANGVFARKEQPNRLDEKAVWGIWVSRRLALKYKILATMLRIPVGTVVDHALTDWANQNCETIMKDKEISLQ